jgi:hypothetical protein
MSTTTGSTHAEFFHPTQDDVYCTVEIKWSHYTSPATLEEPGDDEINIKSMKLLTYCDKYVKDMEVPEWITLDEIYQAIDLDDYYDGDDN